MKRLLTEGEKSEERRKVIRSGRETRDERSALLDSGEERKQRTKGSKKEWKGIQRSDLNIGEKKK